MNGLRLLICVIDLLVDLLSTHTHMLVKYVHFVVTFKPDLVYKSVLFLCQKSVISIGSQSYENNIDTCNRAKMHRTAQFD